MKIEQVMTRDVRTVHRSVSIKNAAMAMQQDGVGALPVTDEEILIGMLTDRDIVTRVVAEGEDPDQVSVSDVMSPRVRYCFLDEDCDEVAQNMADEAILRMPVVDRDKRLVGIVSAGDLQTKASATDANDQNRNQSAHA